MVYPALKRRAIVGHPFGMENWREPLRDISEFVATIPDKKAPGRYQTAYIPFAPDVLNSLTWRGAVLYFGHVSCRQERRERKVHGVSGAEKSPHHLPAAGDH
jgi:hypothetical protein